MINSIQNSPSAAAQVSTRPVQSDFTLACASGSAKGVAVLPLGQPGEFDLMKITKDALEKNGGEPLDQIVVKHTLGGPSMAILNLIAFSSQQKFIAEDGTFALMGAVYDPRNLQRAADQNPGLKIAYQDPRTPKGVTVYEHGKEPRFDPEGKISDGGFGSRSCGTAPGYMPGEAKPTEVSSRLI